MSHFPSSDRISVTFSLAPRITNFNACNWINFIILPFKAKIRSYSKILFLSSAKIPHFIYI